jgi:two-component system chemotaxis response regulator CheY
VSETRKGSVLVIEDDASIRKLVRAVLAREGYDVEVAADGVEGVLKLGLADYDVIILDLMMPHLDGFSFVQALNESAPETLERIIVTSAASPAIIKERLKGARLEVMTKPFDIQALIEKVAASIAARRPAGGETS